MIPIESFLPTQILALQNLASGGGSNLRHVLAASHSYRQGLEAAGLPTRPLQEMAELMEPGRDEFVPDRIAAEAVMAVLRRHNLFPRPNEPLEGFFDRLKGLRKSFELRGNTGPLGPMGRLFQKTQLISSTSNSMVYRAEDVLDDRPVALKVYASGEGGGSLPLQIVLSEIRFQADPVGEGVVQAFNTGRIPMGTPFVAFEWMESEDLRSINFHFHPKRNPLSVERTLNLARQIISAVAQVHAGDVIHRDIKPHNFVMNARLGRIKLTDFSLAIRSDEARPETNRPGTGGYIPKEAYRKGYVDDFRQDVYAMGKTLLEFFGMVLPARLRSRIGDQTPAEKATLTSLRRIVGRSIDSRPSRRYEDARATLEDFDRQLG